MPKLGEHPSAQTSARHSASMKLVWANKKEKEMEDSSAVICTFPQMTKLLVDQYEELRTWNAERTTLEGWHEMLKRHRDERLRLTADVVSTMNYPNDKRARIFQEIHEERQRQDKKWGEQNHPIRREADAAWYAEMAEHFKELCDARAARSEVTWFDIAIEEFFEVFAEASPEGQRHELKHAVGVLEAMIECIDRHSGKTEPSVFEEQAKKKLELKIKDEENVKAVRETLDAYHLSLVNTLEMMAKYTPPTPAERVEMDNLIKDLEERRTLAIECLKDLA